MQIIGTYTDEEIAQREAEMERHELADKGSEDEPRVCELCLGSKDGDHESLCTGCAAYDAWYLEHFGAWS